MTFLPFWKSLLWSSQWYKSHIYLFTLINKFYWFIHTNQNSPIFRQKLLCNTSRNFKLVVLQNFDFLPLTRLLFVHMSRGKIHYVTVWRKAQKVSRLASWINLSVTTLLSQTSIFSHLIWPMLNVMHNLANYQDLYSLRFSIPVNDFLFCYLNILL